MHYQLMGRQVHGIMIGHIRQRETYKERI